MSINRKEQKEIEERLNVILLKMTDLQERIWDGLELLDKRELLRPELDEHIRQVMSDVSYWIDQCTIASESPPVLLRRMEIHLSRLTRIEEMLLKLLE